MEKYQVETEKQKRIRQLNKMAQRLSDWYCENPETFAEGIYIHIENTLDNILRLRNWLLADVKPETRKERLERLFAGQPDLLALLDLSVFDGNELISDLQTNPLSLEKTFGGKE